MSQPALRIVEGSSMDKSKALSAALSQIERQFGVRKELLVRLIGQRLLRADPRTGSTYYELSHDTLVSPILRDRDERERAQQQKQRADVERRRARQRTRWLAMAAVLLLVSAGLSLMFYRRTVAQREQLAFQASLVAARRLVATDPTAAATCN